MTQPLPKVVTEHGVEIVMMATTKQIHLADPSEHRLASQVVAQVLLSCEGLGSLVDSTLDFFPEHVCMAATGSEPPLHPKHNESVVKSALKIIKQSKQWPVQLSHLPGKYSGPSYETSGEPALTRQIR